jgi:hypothetical protein
MISATSDTVHVATWNTAAQAKAKPYKWRRLLRSWRGALVEDVDGPKTPKTMLITAWTTETQMGNGCQNAILAWLVSRNPHDVFGATIRAVGTRNPTAMLNGIILALRGEREMLSLLGRDAVGDVRRCSIAYVGIITANVAVWHNNPNRNELQRLSVVTSLR